MSPGLRAPAAAAGTRWRAAWGAPGLQRSLGRHHKASESKPVYLVSRALRPASLASTSQPAASLRSPRSPCRPGEVGGQGQGGGRSGCRGGGGGPKPGKVTQDPGAGWPPRRGGVPGGAEGKERGRGLAERGRGRGSLLTRCSTMMSRSVSFSPFTGSTMSFRISFSTHSRVTTAPLR